MTSKLCQLEMTKLSNNKPYTFIHSPLLELKMSLLSELLLSGGDDDDDDDHHHHLFLSLSLSDAIFL